MPLLEHNISANEHLFSFTRPLAAVLDWDEEKLSKEVLSLNDGLDAVM